MFKKAILFLPGLLMALVIQATAQDVSIGGRLGRYYSDWDNVSGPAFLSSESSGAESWTFEVYAKRQLDKGFSYGLGLGFTSRNSGLWYRSEDGSYGEGSGFSMPIWSINPMVAKELGLGERLGLKIGLDLPVNFIGAKDQRYNENPFGTILNAETGQPFVDMEVDGETIVERKVSLFIRPELGVFYELGQRGRLTLDAMYGFNPGDPLVVRKFNKVTFDGQTYTDFRHEYEGDYWAVTIGYEYRLFSK